jgi:hypothetical protein
MSNKNKGTFFSAGQAAMSKPKKSGQEEGHVDDKDIERFQSQLNQKTIK